MQVWFIEGLNQGKEDNCEPSLADDPQQPNASRLKLLFSLIFLDYVENLSLLINVNLSCGNDNLPYL